MLSNRLQIIAASSADAARAYRNENRASNCFNHSSLFWSDGLDDLTIWRSFQNLEYRQVTAPPKQIQIIAEIRNPNVMELETLKDLYIHELKDLYSAEKQLTKALPKMAKAAASEKLADGFRMHLDQTEEHVNRLEKILESQSASTRGPKCKGMEGLIEEGEEMIEEDAEDEVRDAGLISAAQRVEHYEIAGYGCARTYAELLGDSEGAKLLQKTLDEEGATDKKLTELAKTLINVRAQSV